MDVYITQTTLGIIGNFVGVALLLTPAPKFIKMLKTKSIDDNSPSPYLVALMSNLIWLVYGLPSIHTFSTMILYVNGVGITIQTIYLFIFIITTKNRVLIITAWGAEVLVVMAIAFTTLTFVESIDTRTLIIGIICCLATIITYAYSLFLFVKEVTKGVDTISIWLHLATLANAAIWTTYAFFPFDPFIAISYGVCTLIGVVQVVLYVYKKYSAKIIVDDDA